MWSTNMGNRRPKDRSNANDVISWYTTVYPSASRSYTLVCWKLWFYWLQTCWPRIEEQVWPTNGRGAARWIHDTTKVLTVYCIARRAMVVQHSPHVAMEQCVTRLIGIMMYGHVETLNTLTGRMCWVLSRERRGRGGRGNRMRRMYRKCKCRWVDEVCSGIRRCDRVWREGLRKRSVASASRRHIRGHIVQRRQDHEWLSGVSP